MGAGETTPTILEWGGGPTAFRRWLDVFYDLIEQEPSIAPLFGGTVSERRLCRGGAGASRRPTSLSHGRLDRDCGSRVARSPEAVRGPADRPAKACPSGASASSPRTRTRTPLPRRTGLDHSRTGAISGQATDVNGASQSRANERRAQARRSPSNFHAIGAETSATAAAVSRIASRPATTGASRRTPPVRAVKIAPRTAMPSAIPS
jgi:hypothetical protein